MTTVKRAARFLVQALKVMRAKDFDYGDAWKTLSIASHIDRIRVKLVRIERLRANGFAQVSEGIEAELIDCINYFIFIKLALEDQEHGQTQQGHSGSEAGSRLGPSEETGGQGVAGSAGAGTTQIVASGGETAIQAAISAIAPSHPLGLKPKAS
jgi:hypothetical protein